MKRFALMGVLVLPLFAVTNVGGVIAVNTVWGPTGDPPDTVYNLVDNVTVLDNVTLTIQPGVKIQSINFGFDIRGSLTANGTSFDPVIFTSAESVPTPGDWSGLTFGSMLDSCPTDSSCLTSCIIEYAQNGIFGSPYVRTEDAWIRYCQTGVRLFANPIHPTRTIISNGLIAYNSQTGIWVEMPDSIALSITWNIIRGNSNGVRLDGIVLPYVPAVEIESNIFEYNTTAIAVYGDYLPLFPQPNQFVSNDTEIHIYSGIHLKSSIFWNPSADGAECIVDDNIDIDTAATFTVTPGNVFKSGGGQFNVFGQLIACGTTTEKITFTSFSSSPNPGDWFGIHIVNTTSDTSMLSNCIVEYAMNGVFGWSTSLLKIENSIIRNNQIGVCYYQYNDHTGNIDRSKAMISISSVSPEPDSCSYNRTESYVQFNEIYDNVDFGIYNDDSGVWINAENNWWGDSSGPCDTSNIDTLYNPGGLGDRVSDYVDYHPWTGYEPGVEEDLLDFVIKNATFHQPLPNPFIDKLLFTCDIVENREIVIDIYNVLGRVVRHMNKEMQKGTCLVIWDGCDNMGKRLPAGVYWCKLKCGDVIRIEKVIKIK